MPGYHVSFLESPNWPIYTPKQLNQYFKTIRLPSKYLKHPIIKEKDVKKGTDADALEVLTYLIRYQLANIPFENLELHYSSHHATSVDPLRIFDKIVDRKCGRGGHCMENTQLFATVLRSLGYTVLVTGARVNSVMQPSSQTVRFDCDPQYDDWNHMVAVVSIGKKKYLVDVGFGNNSLTFPVPLEDGYKGNSGRPGAQLRLHREYIPDNSEDFFLAKLMWIYSVGFEMPGKDTMWVPAYCFGQHEFHPHEFEAMSRNLAKISRSWFTKYVICLKFIMDPHTERIIGDVSLFKREVRERKNGQSKVLTKIKSESDRVSALKKYFGIKLSVMEKQGINGLSSMITKD